LLCNTGESILDGCAPASDPPRATTPRAGGDVPRLFESCPFQRIRCELGATDGHVDMPLEWRFGDRLKQSKVDLTLQEQQQSSKPGAKAHAKTDDGEPPHLRRPITGDLTCEAVITILADGG
jgi:hypothetical protein